MEATPLQVLPNMYLHLCRCMPCMLGPAAGALLLGGEPGCTPWMRSALLAVVAVAAVICSCGEMRSLAISAFSMGET